LPSQENNGGITVQATDKRILFATSTTGEHTGPTHCPVIASIKRKGFGELLALPIQLQAKGRGVEERLLSQPGKN
jgi:hypothetical protein